MCGSAVLHSSRLCAREKTMETWKGCDNRCESASNRLQVQTGSRPEISPWKTRDERMEGFLSARHAAAAAAAPPAPLLRVSTGAAVSEGHLPDSRVSTYLPGSLPCASVSP